MRRVKDIAICVLVVGAVCVGAGRAEESATQSLAEPFVFVEELMKQEGLPSLSVAIGRPGEPIYALAVGLADLELGTPATAESVFRVGSTAKTITATAVLQLAEKGLIDLDAAVEQYCPGFPAREESPTPRLLLSHLGGIRHYNYRRFREEFLSARRHESLDDALSVFKGDPLVAKPGEEYQYSSYGYVLLGCALEGASGDSFAEYLEANIFEPAGMTQARLDVPEEIVPNRTRTYTRASDGSLMNSPFVDLSDRYPAGGLLATPSDLVSFGRALVEGKLVSKESWAAMRQPQTTSSGEDTGYGLGWRLSDEPGEIFHGRSSVGGSAYLLIRVDSGTVVALATNVGRWTEPRHELARRLADWAESR